MQNFCQNSAIWSDGGTHHLKRGTLMSTWPRGQQGKTVLMHVHRREKNGGKYKIRAGIKITLWRV